jgi:hypothetical protein
MNELSIQFGSFGILTPVEQHALNLEREVEYLKSQLINVDRIAYEEKAEMMQTFNAKMMKTKEQMKVLEQRIGQLEEENATLQAAPEPLPKQKPVRHKLNGTKEIQKEMNDEKAIAQALSEKLKLAEERLSEASITITTLQTEAQKIYALRAVLITELEEQYKAGMELGYKAFAKKAYDFLHRFRSGMIDDLISH